MASDNRAIVLFADVVGSRQGAAASTAWLERLCATLDEMYISTRLAPFNFTQGDELQGLLRLNADPFIAILHAALHPYQGDGSVPRMRWAAVVGEVDPGSGPATRRTGAAFVLARHVLGEAKRQSDMLACRVQETRADALLDGTAPVLGAMIDKMTDRQREIARFSIVDGLRQSEIAERLGIARATVSVSSARGDVRNLARLVGAVRMIWTSGIEFTVKTR